MRHFVNFGLLCAFATLAISGGMLFLLPFSLATARVHIVLALSTIALVALHLASRLPYFRARLRPRQGGAAWGEPVAALATVGGLLALAALGWPPVQRLVEQGYEARRRVEIVRPSSLAGFQWSDFQSLAVSRAPAADADLRVSLLVQFAEPVDPPPAIAVWAETTAGAMIETLYLDPRLAYADRPMWDGEPIDRAEILPIWRRAYTLVSGVAPGGEIDATTGATPEHSFSLDDYLVAGDQNEIVVCVEINALGDPNDAYPDPRLGQPSLLYTAYLELDAEQPYALLELTAHGGVGQEGVPQYDLERVTTAKRLVDLLLAKVESLRE